MIQGAAGLPDVICQDIVDLAEFEFIGERMLAGGAIRFAGYSFVVANSGGAPSFFTMLDETGKQTGKDEELMAAANVEIKLVIGIRGVERLDKIDVVGGALDLELIFGFGSEGIPLGKIHESPGNIIGHLKVIDSGFTKGMTNDHVEVEFR